MFSFSNPAPCRRMRLTRFAAVTLWLLQKKAHAVWGKENLPFPNYSNLLKVGDEKSQQLVAEPATPAAPHSPVILDYLLATIKVVPGRVLGVSL